MTAKLRYITNDGAEIVASSPSDVLEALRKQSHTPEDSLDHFKAALVERLEQQTGLSLSDDSYAGVVAALVKTGLLIEAAA